MEINDKYKLVLVNKTIGLKLRDVVFFAMECIEMFSSERTTKKPEIYTARMQSVI